MRNLYLTFLMCAIFALAAYADPVTVEQARQAALRHIAESSNATGGSAKAKSGGITLTLAKTAMQASPGGGETPLYYVFNRDGDSGMVIVAGDDSMRPILAYTDKGRFDEANVNPGMAWWLEAMAHAAQSITEGTVNAAETRAPTTGGRSVAPLIQTQWDQGGVFQLLCPDDYVHGGKSLTGCVATAMAQIMYYWRYPDRGHGTVNYTTQTHGFNINENLENYPFDYDEMLPYYTGNESMTAQMAVARLMYACGVAVSMDYCNYASGSVVTPEIMAQYFGYDQSSAYHYRTDFSVAEWDNLIKTELNNGRPVLYRGGNMSSGHMFICDGYDSDGLFHINWGWGGGYDGWFDLSSLVPTGIPGDGYNIGQSALCGIQPDTGSPQPVDNTYFSYESITADTNVTYRKGGTIPLNLNNFYARGGGFDGYFGVALYEGDGNPVYARCSYPIKVDEYYGYSSYPLTFEIPLSVADGTYTLRPVYGRTQTEYKPMRATTTYGDTYLTVNVSGTVISLSAPEPVNYGLSITGEAVISGGSAYAGHDADITFNIRNDGAEFNQMLHLRDKASQQVLFEDNFIIEEGKTKTMTARISIPNHAGTEEIEVYFDDVNTGLEQVIGTLSLDITVPAEGTPALSLDNMQVITPVVAYDGSVSFTATISNSGGFYDNGLESILGINGWHTYEYQDFMINKGETKTVTISMGVSWLLDYIGVKEGDGEVSLGYLNDSFEIVEFGYRLPFTIVETSGIVNVKAEKEPSKIYSINGLYMGTDTSKLPKGIYIRDGKKFILR